MDSTNKNFKKCNVFNIKSKYIIKRIFNHLNQTKFYSMVKHNKNIINKLDVNIEDFLQIEIELIPKENINGYFISENALLHIFFNDDKEEIKRNYLTKEDEVYKIRIIVKNKLDSFEDLFEECHCIKKINFIKFTRNNITSMRSMFSKCISLEELNLSNFNTKNVKDMSFMFNECESLKELNLIHFNTENVTNMSNMFNGCKSLKELELSNFSGKNLENIESMFSNCFSLKRLNLTNFYIDKPTSIGFMFYQCRSLETLDLSNLHTKKINEISYSFGDCVNLKEIIMPNLKTCFGKNSYRPFDGCDSLIKIKSSDFQIKLASIDICCCFIY